MPRWELRSKDVGFQDVEALDGVACPQVQFLEVWGPQREAREHLGSMKVNALEIVACKTKLFDFQFVGLKCLEFGCSDKHGIDGTGIMVGRTVVTNRNSPQFGQYYMKVAALWYVTKIQVLEIRRLVSSEVKLVQSDIMNPEKKNMLVKHPCVLKGGKLITAEW